MPGTPNRGTSEQELDRFNQQLRASPVYQNFMIRNGLPTDGRVALTTAQQRALEQELARNGMALPSGMKIDDHGNVNQSNRLWRNVAIGAGIGTAAALTGGAALGAFGGAGGAGAAGAGAAGAAAGGGTTAGLAGLAAGAVPYATGAAGLGAGVAGAGAAGAGAAGLAGAGGAAGGGTTAGLGGLAAGAVPYSTAAPTLAGAAGGSSMLSRLGLASDLAGSLGSSMAQNREGRNEAARSGDSLIGRLFDTQQGAASNAYSTEQNARMNALMGQSREQIDLGNLDLNQRQFALNAPNARGRQALIGSLMQHLQPVTMSGLPSRITSRMPTISGGLSPSAIGPLARQMGLLMQQNALSGQQRGDQFAAPQRTNFQGGVMPGASSLLTPPTPTPYQNPGRGESLMGMLGMIGPALRGYSAIRGR